LNTPAAKSNVQDFLVQGGKIGVCGTCMHARGLEPEALAQGAHRSSMEELTCWTKEADKVIVF